MQAEPPEERLYEPEGIGMTVKKGDEVCVSLDYTISNPRPILVVYISFEAEEESAWNLKLGYLFYLFFFNFIFRV